MSIFENHIMNISGKSSTSKQAKLQQNIKIDEDDIDKPEEEKKTKQKSVNDLKFNEKSKEGLKIIRNLQDLQRLSTAKILIDYIEKISFSKANTETLYNLKQSTTSGEEVLELVHDVTKKKKVHQSVKVESAATLLMQLLKSREKHNVDQEYMKHNEDELDSNEIRKIIHEEGWRSLYEEIFNHMVRVIVNKKSNIELCSEYLTEALINYNSATKIQKKYIEDSISRSMKREVNKQNQSKGGNLSEHLNRQFLSPTNNQGVMMGLKKSKKMDFDIDDIGLDDADKQVIDNLNEDDIEDGEEFEF